MLGGQADMQAGKDQKVKAEANAEAKANADARANNACPCFDVKKEFGE